MKIMSQARIDQLNEQARKDYAEAVENEIPLEMVDCCIDLAWNSRLSIIRSSSRARVYQDTQTGEYVNLHLKDTFQMIGFDALVEEI